MKLRIFAPFRGVEISVEKARRGSGLASALAAAKEAAPVNTLLPTS